MKLNSKTWSLGLATAMLGVSAVASADFTGYYDFSNWTLTELGSTSGGFATSIDSNTISLTGTNDESGLDGDTYFTIAAETAGTFSFDWAYSSVDDPGYDAGFYVAGPGLADWVFLTDTSGDAGSVSVTVNSGDLIGFNVYSLDSTFGAGVLTITNFSGPTTEAVPEPASMAVLGLGGLALLRRKRNR